MTIFDIYTDNRGVIVSIDSDGNHAQKVYPVQSVWNQWTSMWNLNFIEITAQILSDLADESFFLLMMQTPETIQEAEWGDSASTKNKNFSDTLRMFLYEMNGPDRITMIATFGSGEWK